jgi:hypothetical protein
MKLLALAQLISLVPMGAAVVCIRWSSSSQPEPKTVSIEALARNWVALARPSNRPAVFISCVSPEFRQTRSRVGAILTRLGYTSVIQGIFGTDPGDLPRSSIREQFREQEREFRYIQGQSQPGQRAEL